MYTKDERIGLFIDGANLYTALRALDIEIDYAKLLKEFSRQARLIRANYYTAIVESEDFSPLKPLIDWMSYNGYSVITKPAKQYTDPQTGTRRTKGNMDVEIAVDALLAADWLDHMILFSGDGDFCALIAAIQKKGVRVTVVSTNKSATPVLSSELRRQADFFLDLDDLYPRIGRTPKKEITEA